MWLFAYTQHVENRHHFQAFPPISPVSVAVPGLRLVYNYHQTEHMPLCFCRHDGGIEHMDIKRSGSQPSGKGPSAYFPGTIRLYPLFEAPPPARAVVASLTL